MGSTSSPFLLIWSSKPSSPLAAIGSSHAGLPPVILLVAAGEYPRLNVTWWGSPPPSPKERDLLKCLYRRWSQWQPEFGITRKQHSGLLCHFPHPRTRAHLIFEFGDNAYDSKARLREQALLPMNTNSESR